MKIEAKYTKSQISKNKKIYKLLKKFINSDSIKFLDLDWYTSFSFKDIKSDTNVLIAFDKTLKQLDIENINSGFNSKIWSHLLNIGLSIERKDTISLHKNILYLQNEVTKWKKEQYNIG